MRRAFADNAAARNRLTATLSRRPERDARAVELSRMARWRLVELVRGQGAWLVGAPTVSTWSKDELVAELLRTEFGQDAHA